MDLSIGLQKFSIAGIVTLRAAHTWINVVSVGTSWRKVRLPDFLDDAFHAARLLREKSLVA